jgi:hypothetical protein
MFIKQMTGYLIHFESLMGKDMWVSNIADLCRLYKDRVSWLHDHPSPSSGPDGKTETGMLTTDIK